MSKTILTAEEVLAEFPELSNFVPNRTTDFEAIASVIGSRNPNHVWPVLNALTKGVKAPISDKLKKLFGEA